MKTVEIYGLYDPETDELRYVGKANNAAKRLKTHLLERKLNRPVNRWVMSLVSQGKAPVMRVLECVSEEEWEAAERRWIAQHRKASKLLNLADGGAMPLQTNEQRKAAAKASNKAQSKKHPAEIEFVRAKQNMARLLARFTKDGDKSGDYFHAYLMRFWMRCYYASDPKNHATWATI